MHFIRLSLFMCNIEHACCLKPQNRPDNVTSDNKKLDLYYPTQVVQNTYK